MWQYDVSSQMTARIVGEKKKEPNILLLYKSESKYESKTYAVSLSNFPCYTF